MTEKELRIFMAGAAEASIGLMHMLHLQFGKSTGDTGVEKLIYETKQKGSAMSAARTAVIRSTKDMLVRAMDDLEVDGKSTRGVIGLLGLVEPIADELIEAAIR